jgi:hypothetical protein
MAQTRMKERTVRFFEIVQEQSGNQVRFEQFDWQRLMSAVARASLAERTLELDRRIIGQTYTYEEEDHLLLHRVKDPGEWLARIDFDTEELETIEQRANEGYLDTSAICFLPYGNLVGMMEGSPSAPSHKSLEAWLREIKPFDDSFPVVRPVMVHAALERLRQATGITTVEIRLGQSRSAVLAEKQGRLARHLRALSEDYGDIRVQLRLSVPRGKANNQDRMDLLSDLSEIADVVPDSADVARAGLIFTEGDTEGRAQLTELVEHQITSKRRVPAFDEDGNSIRISGAVRAILDAAGENEPDLQQAVELT